MSDSSVPTGQLFSRVYLERGKPMTDSKRFRSRVGAFLSKVTFNRAKAAQDTAIETGVKVPTFGAYPRVNYKFDSFIVEQAIRDVLDIITIIYRNIQSDLDGGGKHFFINFVERAMREENMSYRLDADGGVHYYVDEEFERSRASVIAGMAGEQYRAAKESFEDAHIALLEGDTLTAVRRSFDAVENVFKMRFSEPRLGSSEIKSNLTPHLSSVYSGRVANAGARLAASFAEWTNAAHQFRHAPGEADPSPPPMDMAIFMVAEAAAYLRWLVGLPESA